MVDEYDNELFSVQDNILDSSAEHILNRQENDLLGLTLTSLNSPTGNGTRNHPTNVLPTQAHERVVQASNGERADDPATEDYNSIPQNSKTAACTIHGALLLED